MERGSLGLQSQALRSSPTPEGQIWRAVGGVGLEKRPRGLGWVPRRKEGRGSQSPSD